MMPSSHHLFVLCQCGAEAALKRELATRMPSLRAGYQRKGLVTFKSAAEITPELELPSALARVHGMSLGAMPLEIARPLLLSLPHPLRLHVVERERFRPDEGPTGGLAQRFETTLREALGNAFHADSEARPGDLVLDVVVGPDEPPLYGLHRQREGLCPHPGGRYVYPPLLEAPSRAYQKIEDAIRHFQLPVQAGDMAVELGAAPGGATRALLERGVSVCAIDPGQMSDQVLTYEGLGGARARHIALPMAAVSADDLPKHVQWLLMDVHLAPQVAMRSVGRYFRALRPSLLGAVLTLKLNEWSFLERIDAFLAQSRELGLVAPSARQLPSHRQELAIVGLTTLGKRRGARTQP